jgi:predicted DNA-binding transcriptional regulator AlpA
MIYLVYAGQRSEYSSDARGFDMLSNRILSTTEAAKVIGLSPRTLPGLRLRGEGPPFIKLSGRRVGYLESDLTTWIQSQRRRSTCESGPQAQGE